jgi:U3 small nucleolar RNA-associated protein 21
LRFEKKILFYDLSSAKKSREFTVESEIIDYCISSDMRWIGVSCGHFIEFYDILTGINLEKMICANNGVEFSPNLDFLLVSYRNSSHLGLFYNNSHFNEFLAVKTEVIHDFEDNDLVEFGKNNALFRNIVKNYGESTFYVENMKIKGLGLSEGNLIENIKNSDLEGVEGFLMNLKKDGIVRILDELNKHMKSEFDLILSILYKILIYHSKIIEEKDILSFYESYSAEWCNFENECLKAISYLEFEKKELFN